MHARVLTLRPLLSTVALAACGGSTSPDPPVVTPPVAPAPAPAPVPFLSGTARNVVDGSPVGEVAVSVSGIGEAKSDASGRFKVSGPGDGVMTLTLRHPAFLDRLTRARFPGSDLAVTLIPATFDLAAFEEFLPRASGLRRWTTNPVLRVHQSVVDFAEFTNGGYTVTDRVVSGGELDCLVNGVRSSIEPMSSRHLRWERVEMADPLPRGTPIRVDQIPSGTIIAMAAGNLGANGRGGAYPGSDNSFVRGLVFINNQTIGQPRERLQRKARGWRLPQTRPGAQSPRAEPRSRSRGAELKCRAAQQL